MCSKLILFLQEIFRAIFPPTSHRHTVTIAHNFSLMHCDHLKYFFIAFSSNLFRFGSPVYYGDLILFTPLHTPHGISHQFWSGSNRYSHCFSLNNINKSDWFWRPHMKDMFPNRKLCTYQLRERERNGRKLKQNETRWKKNRNTKYMWAEDASTNCKTPQEYGIKKK